MPSPRILPSGIKLGFFRIEKCLGMGGFGISYLATDLQTNTEVVIKENFPSSSASRCPKTKNVIPNSSKHEETFEWARQRFIREARLLAGLHHPGIVQVTSMFEALNTVYYVMNFVKGDTLEEMVTKKGVSKTISESETIGYLKQCLSILDYIHERFIYHRDIKPSNLMITPEGRIILIDFGSARNFAADFNHTSLGTQYFYPPEQMDPNASHGPWTDIYSLGATFSYLILGEAPAVSTLRVLYDPNPKLSNRSDLQARFSQQLLRSIDASLEPKVDQRIKTSHEWLSQLN